MPSVDFDDVPIQNHSNLPLCGGQGIRVHDKESGSETAGIPHRATSLLRRPSPPCGRKRGQPCVVCNSEGKIRLFSVDESGALWRRSQAVLNGPLGAWQLLGGCISQPTVVPLQDGREQILAIGASVDRALWHLGQREPDGVYTEWRSLGLGYLQIAAVQNLDGLIEVFAAGTDGALWHVLQTAPNGRFGEWRFLGGNFRSPLALCNRSGRIDLLAVGVADGALWHRRQVEPDGRFAEWRFVGGDVRQIAGIPNQHTGDMGMEVFALGSDGAIWHHSQVTENDPFSEWQLLGGNVSRPFVLRTSDGRIELFAVGVDDRALWRRSQKTARGRFAAWESLGGHFQQATAAQNEDGRIEIFAAGTEGGLWRSFQAEIGGVFGEWREMEEWVE